MTTLKFIAIAGIVCGLITLIAPQAMRWAVGGWLVVAGILWLVA